MSWHPLATVGLALAASVTGAAAQAPPTESVGVEVLQLEQEKYRRMTVPVTIGDHGPFQFLIDTGAEATVVSRDLADRLQLFDREMATLVAMASTRQVEVTAIPDFGLGSRTFLIQSAPVIEAANIGGADGILGVDSLQNQRVLIDFAKQEIAVADAETLGGNKGFEIVVKARERLGQLIITSAKLDGIPVAVIVDTGAQGSVGNPMLQARLRRAEHLGETKVTDVNGVEMGGMVRLGRDLDLGRARLSNLPIFFADSPTFHSLGLAEQPALILGMEQLKLFKRVAIDFQARRVLFDLPRGTGYADAIRFGASSR